MLSKNEIARQIESKTGIKPNLVKNVLDALAEVATEEVGAGQDFTVPGVARISYRYTSPRRKGELYRKGDTYTGFGGVEQTAEADSKARAEAIKIKADAASAIKKLLPTKGTKSYKAVVARKSK